MKPTIDNVIKLLIGKSAICNLYATNIIEPMAFVITDVKIVKYTISVKGANTPWYTDNTVTILGVDPVPKQEPGVDNMSLFIKNLYYLGPMSQKEFNGKKQTLIDGSSKVYPIGSYTNVEPDNNITSKVGFFFVKFPDGWRIIDNVIYTGESTSRGIDVVRHICRMCLKPNYLPDPENTTKLLSVMLEAIRYFNIPTIDINNEFYPVTFEVMRYLMEEYKMSSANAKTMAGIIKIDREDNYVSTAVETILHLHSQQPYSSSKTKQIDVKNELMARGLPPTQAAFAAKILKPDGDN